MTDPKPKLEIELPAGDPILEELQADAATCQQAIKSIRKQLTRAASMIADAVITLNTLEKIWGLGEKEN